MDYLADLVVIRSRHAVLSAVGADNAVYRVDFALLALFKILEHARLEEPVLLDADWDEREGYLLLYAVALVIEELHYILALNRLYFYARSRGDIDALFYKVLAADTRGLVLCGVAESAAMEIAPSVVMHTG